MTIDSELNFASHISNIYLKATKKLSVLCRLRCVTRIFWGRGVLLELGHFNKHSPKTQEIKAKQGKNFHFFRVETLKNFILHETFYS